MNTRGLLDQLLKSGQDLLQNKAGGTQNKPAAGGLGGLLGGASGSGGLGGLLSGAGGGALAAGAMGLLLGNKKVRKVGGKVAIYGGLAALGEEPAERGVSLVTAVMREVIAAARADGVVLPDEMPQQQIEATRKMGAYRTSTQADRQNGRAIELESMFGRPLRVAQEAGVATPNLELLHLALSLL